MFDQARQQAISIHALAQARNLNYGSNIAAVSGSSVKRTAFGISKSF